MNENPKAIQLKISLMGSLPLIWRRLVVESDINFLKLHDILQDAMGWENYHLFSFQVENYVITEFDENFEDFGPSGSKSIDAEEITLDEALLKGGINKFNYEYDFGDGWMHQIEVEKIEEVNDEQVYPVCIDGEMNCPPEDCGGIPGFIHLLDVLKNKNDPDYEETKEWLGENYDPKYFDKDRVNLLFTLKEDLDDPNYENELDPFNDAYEDEDFMDDWLMGPLNVQIVNKSEHPLPEYASEASAGMDLRANLKKQIKLKPLERAVIKTGLFIELPQNCEAQIRPRSGLAAKHGITILNAPGTIDADYRGEIGVILVNLSNEEYTLKNGDRIAQMVITHHDRVEWEEVKKLGETKRGEGGFGSTGFQ